MIICEGAFSSIAAGINSVATLGKRATPEQLRRLGLAKVEQYIIAYDAGEEHSEKAVELANRLSNYGKRVIMRAYPWGDPDSCTDMYTETPYDLAYACTAKLFFNKKPTKYKSSLQLV